MSVIGLVLVLLGAGEGEAPADDDLTSLLSETVTAVASRTAESAQDAPATTWSISGTDLKRYGIQSVEEAIHFLGHGMNSYEFDGRQSAAFGARGFNSDQLGYHLAVLIDGNQAGGSAKTGRGVQPYLMPIELVDHIDIVIGPGSVMFGNSAMLGIINVITRTGASLDGTHVVVQGNVGAPGDFHAKDASWGEVWAKAVAYGGFSRSLGGQTLDVAWHVQARWDRQQGRRMFHNTSTMPYEEIDTAFPTEDVFSRDLGTRLFGRATWGKWRALAWVMVTGGTGTGPIDASGLSSYFEPEYGLDVTYATPVGSRGDLSLRVYGVVFDSRATLGKWEKDPAFCQMKIGADDCNDTLSYLNYRPFIEPIFTWDWARDGSHVTTAGGQLFIDGSLIIQGTSSLDGKTRVTEKPIEAPLPNAALYAQHIWHSRFGTFNLGVRGDLGFIASAVSPRFAYTVSPWRGGSVKLIFSTGFRQPTITERYLDIPGFVAPNEKIGAEHVYSGEIVLGHRFGTQSAQLSLYATLWDGIIASANIAPPPGSLSQFQNLRTLWSAGANLGWRGEVGPVDWSVSLNYAPGRVRLPPEAASWTDAQLESAQIRRETIARFGTSALNSIFMPADGMPDFYAIAHVSYAPNAELPRLSLALNVNSPRIRSYYLRNSVIIDPRFADDPFFPWSADARAVLSHTLGERVGLSLYATLRTLGGVVEAPRSGSGEGPLPKGGIGFTSNPQAPVSLMAEINVRL